MKFFIDSCIFLEKCRKLCPPKKEFTLTYVIFNEGTSGLILRIPEPGCFA